MRNLRLFNFRCDASVDWHLYAYSYLFEYQIILVNNSHLVIAVPQATIIQKFGSPDMTDGKNMGFLLLSSAGDTSVPYLI